MGYSYQDRRTLAVILVAYLSSTILSTEKSVFAFLPSRTTVSRAKPLFDGLWQDDGIMYRNDGEHGTMVTRRVVRPNGEVVEEEVATRQRLVRFHEPNVPPPPRTPYNNGMRNGNQRYRDQNVPFSVEELEERSRQEYWNAMRAQQQQQLQLQQRQQQQLQQQQQRQQRQLQQQQRQQQWGQRKLNPQKLNAQRLNPQKLNGQRLNARNQPPPRKRVPKEFYDNASYAPNSGRQGLKWTSSVEDSQERAKTLALGAGTGLLTAATALLIGAQQL